MRPTSLALHKIHFLSSLISISTYKRLQCGLFGQIYAEYLSFTMAISVSPRYPSHYLYSIHTCACDLCA